MLGPQEPSREPRALGRRRSGPVPGFHNPYPTDDGIEEEPPYDWIDPVLLDLTEERLRQYLGKRRKELRRQSGEDLEAAPERIAVLGRAAVEETEAAWWSAQLWPYRTPPSESGSKTPPWQRSRTRNFFWAKPHVGPAPPAKRAAHGSPWLDTSTTPHILKLWDKKKKSWTGLQMPISDESARDPEGLFKWAWQMTQPSVPPEPYRWRHERALLPATRRMAAGQMGRAGKSGRPAYLAYAILGALLKVSPERIADTLNHHRRTRSKDRSL